MKKQEKIRGILENGLVTWYKESQYGGYWIKDQSFVSTQLETQIRKFNNSIEFSCMIDHSLPTWFITESDVVQISTLSADEHTKTIFGQEFGKESRLRSEMESNPNYKDYFGGNDKRNTVEESSTQRFLKEHTPAEIAKKLNEYVLGQETLTKHAADFLYYHAMRLENPNLPPRPLLISGPSGSGKTEVWRVIRDVYGTVFKIKIVNGARITQEGWKGNTKTLSFIDESLSDGGILVVDEFDKLATPQYSSGGDNVAERIQSEFLKLLEGEEVFFATDKRGRVSSIEVTSKNMGFVLVGAFDQLLQKQDSVKQKIGFTNISNNATFQKNISLTDENLIDFGVIPELVGRIAQKCTTNILSPDDYLRIVKNNNSRVSKLIDTLSKYGKSIENIIDDDAILELVKTSQANRTGVRWVSSQIENLIINEIHNNGINHR